MFLRFPRFLRLREGFLSGWEVKEANIRKFCHWSLLVE